MNFSDDLKKEIEKYLLRKNVYFNNFSNELKCFLAEKFYYLPTIRAQWFMLSNNLTSIPLCSYPNCKEFVKWNEIKKNFDKGCCVDHNKKITFLKNFGVDHPNKSKKHQRKVKKSMREKYGVDFITQTEKHKESVRNTIQQNYGLDSVLQVPEIREKIKQTNFKKYGFKESLASPQIREKSKKTNLKKFGVECSLSSQIVREKAFKTNFEKYGSIFPMRNEELLEKRRLTIVEKYDVNGVLSFQAISDKVRKKHFKRFYENKLLNNDFIYPLFTLEEYKGTKAIKDYKWLCKNCSNEFFDNVDNGHMPRCTICFPKDKRVSNAETELFEAIDSQNKIQTNRNLIIGGEIDIYFPNEKIGIEYNGMFWHSEQKGIDKFYHLDKTIKAENVGIFLIHIFEIEWLLRRNQVISIVEKYLGKYEKIILVDDVKVEEISEKITNTFIENNSFYLFGSYSEKRIGAFFEDELVAVMTVKFFKNKMVITKFFEKSNVSFKGNIFEKLFKTFKTTKNIFYFPDRRFNKVHDLMLISCGFTFEGGTEPELLFSRQNTMIPLNHINNKNILRFIVKYDEKLSIYENMILNGYLTIWDCGKLVFKKTIL